MENKTVFNGFNSNEKILHHIDKLDHFFGAQKTLVVTELDLTNKCNNNCPLCVGVKENGSELTWDEIEMIARGLKDLENRGVIVSGGGEPLLHPRFIDALELLKNSGMELGLNSNGLALDEEKAEAIAKFCSYFRISLDAGTPEMYKKTHGMPEKSFRKVCENIKLMADVKKRTGSAVSFTVGFLTGKETLGDMEAFVALCKECGAGAAQFRPFTGDNTDVTDEILRLKEKYEDDSFRVAASFQKYRNFDEKGCRSYGRCRGMFFSTVITADCKLFGCLHHRQEPDFLIGDMRGENKTLEEAWSSYRKWQVYENIDVSKCPPYCRNDSFNRVLEELSGECVHKEFM
ncbi:MAG: radical SAM protein [Clostridia bacterium]|nr:radical SAM protein [Clostridia bacterium]